MEAWEFWMILAILFTISAACNLYVWLNGWHVCQSSLQSWLTTIQSYYQQHTAGHVRHSGTDHSAQVAVANSIRPVRSPSTLIAVNIGNLKTTTKAQLRMKSRNYHDILQQCTQALPSTRRNVPQRRIPPSIQKSQIRLPSGRIHFQTPFPINLSSQFSNTC